MHTEPLPTTRSNSNALPVGYRLGEYEIEGVLGHGGFGITYVARDVKLGARVAIKEYFPQAYAGRHASEFTIHPFTRTPNEAENYRWGLEAFLTEAQALARFKHPHIVRVLRFLEANGTAYLVMEYEEGESLLAYLRKHSGFLDESMLLGVFLPILTGLQAVHDAGLLHLDIKPDNIYLRRDGHPMLIDFGSARQVREGAHFEQKVALSRGYAAPEQYPGHGERGPWTDVYGVGAAMYRCITGKEPLDALERMMGIAKVKHDPMVAATALERPLYSRHIRECVDAALRIDADARARSARILQNGLMGKGLKDEGSRAFTPLGKGAGFIGVAGGVTQEKKRRKRRGALEWLVATTVLIATAVVVIPKILIDTGELTDTELLNTIDEYHNLALEKSAELRRYINEDLLGMRRRPELAPAPHPVVTRRRAAAPATAEIAPFNPQASIAHTLALAGAPGALAFAKSSSLLAVALDSGAVELWNTASGERVRALAPPGAEPAVVGSSADGRWLAWSGKDRSLWLWDAREDRAPLVLPGHIEAVTALAFSPDGRLLASAGRESSVIVWDVESGKRHQDALSTRAAPRALAFSPNGRVLAAADADGGLQYWGISVRDEKPGDDPVRTYGAVAEMSYVPVADGGLTSVAFSPDGKWLAVGGEGGFLNLLEVGVGRNDRALKPAPDTVLSLAFTPDRKWLLVSGSDSSIHSWKLDTATPGDALRGHDHDVYALAVSSDGRVVASGGDDRTIRIWK